MKANILVIAATAATLAISAPAIAVDVAVCGASIGWSYFPQVGLMADDADGLGWGENAIPDGAFTLTLSDDNSFDLLFSDTLGGVHSARSDGAQVAVVGLTDVAISVIVAYPRLVETYTFMNSETGPEAMWTSNKFDTLILNASLFRAPCDFVAIP